MRIAIALAVVAMAACLASCKKPEPADEEVVEEEGLEREEGESKLKEKLRTGGKGAGAEGWGSEPVVTIMIQEGHPDRDCVYDAIMEATDDDELADRIYEKLEDFEPPGELVQLEEQDVIDDVLDELRSAGCDIGKTEVIKGDIVWRLKVTEEGTGLDCMADVLSEEFHATSRDEWKSRLGQGREFYDGTEPAEVNRIKEVLESKCKCTIRKEYSVQD
jgi:hypothetical protein